MKKFEAPEMEVLALAVEDVLTASSDPAGPPENTTMPICQYDGGIF